nr:MAG: hypothetical protein [Caudoviricetes sp.]
MIKYSYKITKFNVIPTSKQINSVEWWYVGDEDGIKYEIFNVTQLNKIGSKFIPIDQLKENDVIKFIEKSLDKEYIKSMKEVITMEIDKQKTPETVSITPPWIEMVD